MKTKVLFIINPHSGRKRRKDIEVLAHQRMNPSLFDLEFRYTEYAGHAVEIARESDADVVVAVGGDGTVNEVARGLLGSGKVMGIIPMGSGNGLALHFGISRNPARALDVISRMKVAEMDCGTIDGRLFCCTCGVGLDAEVSARFASSSSRGLGTYILDALKVWNGYKPSHYILTIDGRKLDTDAVLITVGNACQWGNNAYICPGAETDDGLLDITLIKPFNSLAIPVLARFLMTGMLKKSVLVRSYRGREIRIVRDSKGWAHYDGDCVELGDDINIGIKPSTLKVIVP